jgi:hypothetical protein
MSFYSTRPIITRSEVANISPVVHVDVSCNHTVSLQQNLDAFARLRVSNPYTLFEFHSILDRNPFIIDEQVTGGGSITHDNYSYFSMNVDASGDRVIRQSHEYILYQPGKSKLVLLTGILFTDSSDISNLTARIGSFDGDFGIYLEVQNGIFYAVEHDSVFFRVPRSEWDDPLDGSGPSGINVDFTKANIFWWDFEWLGVGQVRCGVIYEGVFYTYYIFRHTGTQALTAPYIPMAKLPVRYEIISTGSTNEMRMMCGTVISEGGFSPLGRMFTFMDADVGKDVNDAGGATRFTPIMALTLRNTDYNRRATIKIKNIDIFNVTNNTTGSWRLVLNPTITVPITWTDYDVPKGSVARVAKTTAMPTFNTITGGTILYSGFYATRENSTFNTTTDELIASIPITTGINNVPDVVVLLANTYSTGTDPRLYFSVQWIELI